MKRALCILAFCVLLAGCDADPSHIVNDLDKDEPIRIVAVLQSSVPATATPNEALGVKASPALGAVLDPWGILTPTQRPTPAPTSTPTATPMPTAMPTVTPKEDETPTPEILPTATPDLPQGMQLVMIAQQYYNYPYARGGDSPREGFDPSGFVYWCLKEMGLNVKRRSSAGYAEEEKWTKIARLSDLTPGDLVFFRTGDNENINCVCIYLGENRMIYPSTSKQTIIVTEINNYWTNAFQWARRVF
ncbi:MAG: C40 family peptidase [Clostridia bacterium]|nr:C40 family peptidase [Clostridia bacterium]